MLIGRLHNEHLVALNTPAAALGQQRHVETTRVRHRQLSKSAKAYWLPTSPSMEQGGEPKLLHEL
jgi:hypothetical protein